LKKLIRYIIDFFIGVAHGVGTVVPGVSGGIVLVVCDVYDKFCAALALDFASIKKDFVFYVLFGIGTLAGIFGFAQVINVLLDHFPVATYLVLSAMIVAGLPSTVKAALKNPDSPNESKNRFNPVCLIPFLLGALLISGLFIADEYNLVNETDNEVGIVWLALYSCIGAIGAMIPGVSGSFLLLAFGVYTPIMNALDFNAFDFSVLIPAVIGIVVGLVAGARLIRFLLKRWRLMVYSAIIGMVGSSVVMITLGAILNWQFVQ